MSLQASMEESVLAARRTPTAPFSGFVTPGSPELKAAVAAFWAAIRGVYLSTTWAEARGHWKDALDASFMIDFDYEDLRSGKHDRQFDRISQKRRRVLTEASEFYTSNSNTRRP